MRQVLAVHKAPTAHWVGDGFHVRSLISPQRDAATLSPFLMLDYAAPETFTPTSGRRGVGQHPHRGFETVTIVYEGELEHRDSTGAGGTIGPGDVQWMTAAAGILHEEFHSEAFARKGGRMSMVQLWINLPAKHKSAPPGYQTLLARDIPSITLPEGAGTVRIIAGAYGGRQGPARAFTPVGILDVRLDHAGGIDLAPPEGHSAALVMLEGSITVNEHAELAASEIAVLDRNGGAVSIRAREAAKLLLLSGEPILEPVVAHGPFVMNTLGEIKQAMLDYERGKFGEIARAG